MIQLKVLNACNNIRIGLCFSCVLHQDNLLFKWFYYYLQQSWPPKDHRTKPILEIHPSKPQLSYRPVKHQIDYDSELFMAILYQRKYSSKKSSLSQNITYYYIAVKVFIWFWRAVKQNRMTTTPRDREMRYIHVQVYLHRSKFDIS